MGKRLFIGNWARDENLTKLPNGICTHKNLFKNMKNIFLGDFDKQADHLILARRPGFVIN